MNDPFLMRVLDRMTNLREQFEPLVRTEIILVAVIRDFNPAHQFHHKERSARFRRSGIKHLRDVRVIHEGQGLSLGLETRNDSLRVHAQLNDLERDTSPHGFLLLSHVNDTATTLAQLLKQFVPANLIARLLRYESLVSKQECVFKKVRVAVLRIRFDQRNNLVP